MTDLFTVNKLELPCGQSANDAPDLYVPLAEQLRPQSLNELLGQDHITSIDGLLHSKLAEQRFGSMIFWGGPGTGKTSLARLLADNAKMYFEQISAIFSGVTELKKIFEAAKQRRSQAVQTLLFVDEIHRFNRAQQDCFLPFMEDGTIILIGATTENPSFSLNSALLSRVRVLVFKSHDFDSLSLLLSKAEAYIGRSLPIEAAARDWLINRSQGDARLLLSLAEDIFSLKLASDDLLDAAGLASLLQLPVAKHDAGGDSHYNLISALHKSVRGSDVDASLYYLCRMLDGGEDRLFLARRLIRIAVEDIGLADPQALVVANAARDAYMHLGSPEGELALAQACVYLATAPKSNAVYKAYKGAYKAARKYDNLPPPQHILNAPTKLMKDLSYGADYQYDHDCPDAFSGANFFPAEMGRDTYYQPVERGFEREINKRLQWWLKLRKQRSS